MNKPTKGKLTCKGNVPAQLASVEIDHKKLFHTTIGGIEVDVSDLMEEAAQRVIDAVAELTNKKDESYSILMDRANGAGYMEEWKACMAEMATTALCGTACQGWGFKNLVAKTNGFSPDLFNSQTGAKADVEVESDFD